MTPELAAEFVRAGIHRLVVLGSRTWTGQPGPSRPQLRPSPACKHRRGSSNARSARYGRQLLSSMKPFWCLIVHTVIQGPIS
jgi:hypothetical protein